MAAKSLAKLFSYGGRLTPTGLRRSIRLGGAVALNDAFVKDNQFLGSSLDGSLPLHGHGQPFHTSNSHSKRQTAKVFQRMMASENRTIEICKLVNPRDANPIGRMHGGNVLSLLEEAGIIAATRHINMHKDPSHPPCVAALARMEKVDFHTPISVGDVVEVDSEVTFTSARSCEVCVTIETISTMRGDMKRRLATTAHLWFVPIYQDLESGDQKIAQMPPLINQPTNQAAAGKARYEAQLQARSIYKPAHLKLPVFMATTRGIFDKGTVRNSQIMMTHFVNVTDCDMFRQMRGGAIMKLADEACGSTAFAHSESVCVTASVDACNFRVPIPAGAVVFFDSYVTFTSDRSMEIEVVVHHGGLNSRTMELEIFHNSFNALYTFIPIDIQGKAKPSRQLILETDSERDVFEQGRDRYELRKAERLKQS